MYLVNSIGYWANISSIKRKNLWQYLVDKTKRNSDLVFCPLPLKGEVYWIQSYLTNVWLSLLVISNELVVFSAFFYFVMKLVLREWISHSNVAWKAKHEMWDAMSSLFWASMSIFIEDLSKFGHYITSC